VGMMQIAEFSHMKRDNRENIISFYDLYTIKTKTNPNIWNIKKKYKVINSNKQIKDSQNIEGSKPTKLEQKVVKKME
jgi:hypothetical protein